MSLDLLVLRTSIVAALKAKLPGVDIAEHGGVFDLPEIKRYAALAPAVRVAIVGAAKGYRWSDGRWAVPVQCAAVVVTKDAVAPDRTATIGRDQAGLLLTTAVELAVQANRFGLEGVRQPENVTARNEYSGAVDGVGLALWQITWSSDVLLGEKVDESIAAILRVLAVEGDATPIEAATQILPATEGV